jgi:hypothetical protein
VDRSDLVRVPKKVELPPLGLALLSKNLLDG